MAATIKLIGCADVDTALAEVEEKCGAETANLLRAVFNGYSALASTIGVYVGAVKRTDTEQPMFIPMLRYADIDRVNG